MPSLLTKEKIKDITHGSIRGACVDNCYGCELDKKIEALLLSELEALEGEVKGMKSMSSQIVVDNGRTKEQLISDRAIDKVLSLLSNAKKEIK